MTSPIRGYRTSNNGGMMEGNTSRHHAPTDRELDLRADIQHDLAMELAEQRRAAGLCHLCGEPVDSDGCCPNNHGGW